MDYPYENESCYVYVLIHVEQNKIFYVGRGTTIGGKMLRYERHLYNAAKGSNLHVCRKIRKLQSDGQTIKFEPRVTGATLEQAERIEKDLIASIGLDNLTNISPGGNDFTWIWGHDKEHPRAVPIRTITWIENHRRASRKRRVYLRNVYTNEALTFDSLHSAARHLGVNTNAIWQAANGKSKQSKSYRVSYTPI